MTPAVPAARAVCAVLPCCCLATCAVLLCHWMRTGHPQAVDAEPQSAVVAVVCSTLLCLMLLCLQLQRGGRNKVSDEETKRNRPTLRQEQEAAIERRESKEISLDAEQAAEHRANQLEKSRETKTRTCTLFVLCIAT